MRARDPKAIILERRARFIAASLAAVTGLTAAPRAFADGGDASADAADAADGEDAGDAEAEPRACLCAMKPPATPDGSTGPAIVAAVALIAAARRWKRTKT